jgi:hypothetical protein
MGPVMIGIETGETVIRGRETDCRGRETIWETFDRGGRQLSLEKREREEGEPIGRRGRQLVGSQTIGRGESQQLVEGKSVSVLMEILARDYVAQKLLPKMYSCICTLQYNRFRSFITI